MHYVTCSDELFDIRTEIVQKLDGLIIVVFKIFLLLYI